MRGEVSCAGDHTYKEHCLPVRVWDVHLIAVTDTNYVLLTWPRGAIVIWNNVARAETILLTVNRALPHNHVARCAVIQQRLELRRGERGSDDLTDQVTQKSSRCGRGSEYDASTSPRRVTNGRREASCLECKSLIAASDSERTTNRIRGRDQ